MEHLDKVRVYRNLKTGNWSIQTKTPKGWRVRGHATAVELLDADCHVSKAGRAKVLREKRKNVHAYIEGLIDLRNMRLRDVNPKWAYAYGILEDMDAFPYGNAERISYNPYKAGTFTTSDGEPVYDARCVRLNPNASVYAIAINHGLQSTSTQEAEDWSDITGYELAMGFDN